MIVIFLLAYQLLQLIGDLTNESFNEKLISATLEKFGKLDVLVRPNYNT